MRILVVVTLLGITVLVAACAGPAADTGGGGAASQPPATSSSPEVKLHDKAFANIKGGNGSATVKEKEEVPVALTRFVGLSRTVADNPGTTCEWPCATDFENAYAGIEIVPEVVRLQDGSISKTFNEPQGLFGRFFNPKDNVTAFTIQVAVNRTGPTAQRHVLMTRSDKDSAWQTDVVVSHVAVPLFRVEPNTILGVQAKLEAEEVAEPRFAKLLFQAAENIAAVAAPGSGLLTVLAKPGTDRTKLLIDSTLGQLFSQKQSESVRVERQLASFSARPEWRVSLYLSAEGSKQPRKAADWFVRLSYPQPSLFSSRTYVKPVGENTRSVQRVAAYSDVTAADVLDKVVVYSGEPGAGQPTLRQMLEKRTNFTDLLLLANSATESTAVKGIAGLCGLVRETIRAEGLRLTSYDEAAVVWAVFKLLHHDASSIQKMMKDAKAVAECNVVYDDLQAVNLLGRL